MKTHRKTNSLYILFLMIFTLMGSTLFADVEPEAKASISPVTQNIKIGTTEVVLYVLLDKCPKADLYVTYVNDSNVSDTGTLFFDKQACSRNESFTVYVPSDLVGNSFDVNISSTDASAVEPSQATVTILDLVSDLTIEKKTSKNIINSGGEFTYSIIVSNDGLDDANNTIVTDTIDEDLTFVDFGVNLGWDCSYIANSRTVTCSADNNITADSELSFDFNVTAPTVDSGEFIEIDNTATVTSGNDIALFNNIASVSVKVVESGVATDVCFSNSVFEGTDCSDLVGISYYYEGGNNKYCKTTISIFNQTGEPLSDVNVTKLYTSTIFPIPGDCNVSQGDGCDTLTEGYTYHLGDLDISYSARIYDTNTQVVSPDTTNISLVVTETGLPIYSCPGGTGIGGIDVQSFLIPIDIIDSDLASYGQIIKTKVSNRPAYHLNAVYLGDDLSSPDPDATFSSGIDMTLLYYLYDDENEDCMVNTNLRYEVVDLTVVPGSNTNVSSTFTNTDSDAESTEFTMAFSDEILSKRRVRIAYQPYDLAQAIIAAGINCSHADTSGSTYGTVTGIPACLTTNSTEGTPAENYEAVFGEETFERCYEDVSNGQPCTASADYRTTPAPYDTVYGCLECTLGELPFTCSSDAFAIRPDKLTFEITDADTLEHFPDLLRAGHDYNISVDALNYDGVTHSVGYNQTSDNFDPGTPLRWFNTTPKTLDTTGLLVGEPAMNNSIIATITDGVMTSGGVGYAYLDVGFITMIIEDQDWAAVDISNPNDTTLPDCSADGAYICSDLNGTFIPDHFDVNATLYNNNNDVTNPNANTFTYLSTDINMSARYRVEIIARNEVGGSTLNFREGTQYYEHNLTVHLTAPPSDAGTAIFYEIDPAIKIGFDVTAQGTVTWDDANDSQRLSFNYPRTTNTPINPFRIDANQTAVNVKAVYTGAAPGSPADIVGLDDNADGNVTFVYGRAHAPRYRAMCDGSPCPANVTFFYEFYADNVADPTLITNLLGSDKRRSIDSVNWYRNILHDTATDGNITMTTQNIPGVTTQLSFAHATQTTSSSYVYTGSDFPYKGTITIPQILTPGAPLGAPGWLIYDKYKPDSNTTSMESAVEYYGPGTWSSNVEGGTTKSESKGRNTNRRIRW